MIEKRESDIIKLKIKHNEEQIKKTKDQALIDKYIINIEHYKKMLGGEIDD